MNKKWEVRTNVDGELKIDLFGNDYNTKSIREFINNKYCASINKKIINISGAFDAIIGRTLFLGTHAINSSLDLGFPYSKTGNKFYELIDPELEKLRLDVEKKPNTIESDKAIRKLEKFFEDNDLGIADIIDFCVATGSEDTDILLNEGIVWNNNLLQLLSKADIVVLNGKTKSKTKPCTFMFLNMFLNENGIEIDDEYIYIGEKKIRYVMLYSSSGGVRPKFNKKREEEWKSLFKNIRIKKSI